MRHITETKLINKMQHYQKKHKYKFIIANNDVIISNSVVYSGFATLYKVYSVLHFSETFNHHIYNSKTFKNGANHLKPYHFTLKLYHFLICKNLRRITFPLDEKY